MDFDRIKQWTLTALMSGALLLPTAAQQGVPAPESDADAPLQSNPERNQLDLANRFYDEAKTKTVRAERQDAFRQVIPLYQRFLQNFPQSSYRSFAEYRLGYSHLVIGQAPVAEQYFTRVVRSSEDKDLKAIAAHRMGTILLSREQFREATKYFEITVANASQATIEIDATYRLGRCHLKTGDRERAVAAFEKVLKDANPDNQFVDAATLYLGNLLLQEEKYEEALKHFDKLTGQDKPEMIRGEAALQAGHIATRLGRIEDANGYFVLLLNTDSLATWRGEAQLGLMGNYFQAKKWENVVKVFDSHKIVMPEQQDARRLLLYAKALFEMKRYARAALAFSKVERLMPLTEQAFNANYLRLICGYQQRIESLPRQVDAFLEVYQPRFPNSPLLDRALLLKAETLYISRQLAAAAVAYQALDPEQLPKSQRADALYRSAWVLTEIDDYAAALRRFDTFLTNYSEHKDRGQALVKRAYCRIKLGDSQGGLEDYAEVVRSFPKSTLASFALQQSALIHGKAGNNDQMVSLFQILIRDFPTLKPAALAEAHFWIGRGLFDQDKFQDAIPHLEEARQLVPEKYEARGGTLLVLANYSLADVRGLRSAVDRLLIDAPRQKIAPTVLAWLGLQCAKVGDFKATNRYLSLAANPSEPKTTRKLIWKNLSRARLELELYESALEANNNYLAEEKQEFFIAEGNLERANILLGLKRPAEAREAVEKALGLNPQGALLAQLRMSLGDVEAAEGNFDKAATHYIVVAELFANDDRLKPQALLKAADSLDKAGKKTESQRYRDLLNKNFPGWKAQ